MRIFKLTPGDYVTVTADSEEKTLLKKEAFERFNVDLLDLGDVKKESTATDAIAAFFDLEGFTNFCKQIEPHLSVPVFLSEFLTWFMKSIRSEMLNKEHNEGMELFSELPFFVKFMGDGLLLLWDTSSMNLVERRNVLVSALELCREYKRTLLPKLRKLVVDPPPLLRCGLARGTVYSVGDGKDYVGSCINMAARLQKLQGVTFSFNIRGFDLAVDPEDVFFTTTVVVKKIPIRGIGENELVAILASELKAMKVEDAKNFKSA